MLEWSSKEQVRETKVLLSVALECFRNDQAQSHVKAPRTMKGIFDGTLHGSVQGADITSTTCDTASKAIAVWASSPPACSTDPSTRHPARGWRCFREKRSGRWRGGCTSMLRRFRSQKQSAGGSLGSSGYGRRPNCCPSSVHGSRHPRISRRNDTDGADQNGS